MDALACYASAMDKTSILSLASRLRVEPVTIDGVADPIFLRTLTGRERDGFENACFTQRGKDRVLSTENIRAKLLVRSICTEKGERIFQDNEAELLGSIPADILDILFTKAQKMSGLAPADVEELAGN